VALVGMIIDRGKPKMLGGKPVLAPLCPHKSHMDNLWIKLWPKQFYHTINSLQTERTGPTIGQQ
jgi:hypothetical protein